jgi:hypothetical protein
MNYNSCLLFTLWTKNEEEEEEEGYLVRQWSEREGWQGANDGNDGVWLWMTEKEKEEEENL